MLKRLHPEGDIRVFVAPGGGRSNPGESRLGRALTGVTEAAGI